MKNRLVQLVLIVLTGAILAWLFMRDDEPEPETLRASVAEPRPGPGSAGSVEAAPSSRAPPKVTFQLPKMGTASKGEVMPEPAKPPTTLQIPKDWLLRGSGSKNYELRSDKSTAF